MSILYKCDCCGKTIEEPRDRIRRVKGRVMIEVMVRFDKVWNAGHVCEDCVIDVVKNGSATDDAYISDLNAERSAA
jgi:hypothetical protein